MTAVLFEHHHLYYLPQFIPVIREMQRRGEYKIYISIANGANDVEKVVFQETAHELGVEILQSESEVQRRQEIQQRNFDIVVVGNKGHINSIASDNTFVVLIYHGIGLKQSYYRDTSSRVDLRAVESTARFNELKDAGETNLVLCGFTKLDPLVKPTESDNKTWLSNHGLNPDQPTLLYAPSFYPTSIELLLPEFSSITNEVNIIIKLHHFSWFKKKYRHHVKLARRVAQESKNIFLVLPEEYNIIPYFQIADGLISGISSTLFEYLALNRPIIQTNFITRRIKHRVFPWLLNRRLDFKRYEQIDFVDLLEDPRDLKATVRKAIENPRGLSSVRQRAVDRFLFKLDGQASVRLVNAIESQLSLRSN